MNDEPQYEDEMEAVMADEAFFCPHTAWLRAPGLLEDDFGELLFGKMTHRAG